MSNHALRLLTILLLILAATGCTGLQNLEAPDISVTSLRLLEAEQRGLEQRFAVGLRIINPNDRALTVNGLDFELDVNGRQLVRGVSDRRFELPRLGEAETEVIVTTSVLDLLWKAVEFGSRADGKMDYRLKGRLHLGSGLVRTIPFDHRGTLAP